MGKEIPVVRYNDLATSEAIPVMRYDDLSDVMGELIPVDPGPVPRDPCPACGRHLAEWLSWGEAYDRHGIARASCMSCLRTDIPFVATFL